MVKPSSSNDAEGGILISCSAALMRRRFLLTLALPRPTKSTACSRFSRENQPPMIGLKMTGRIQQFAALARAFARSRRGNVAMLFAISLVPLMLAAGVGLDYARAML